MMRIGQGWDSHRLDTGRKLMLGGVEVPYHQGLAGHSDADALLHAVTDALLGAAGLPDIGRQFPDNDPAYEGADSLKLLQITGELLRQGGWRVNNIDSTIIAQQPRLTEYLPAMAANIAVALGVDISRVSVKAKTAEGLGPAGEGLSMEALAVALVEDSHG